MKTLDELLKEQDDWCWRNSCVGCPYSRLNPNPTAPSVECTTVFVYEKMKEAMDRIGKDTNVPTKKSNADKMKAVELPKWCKEGQWVMDEDGAIYKIDCITGDLVSVCCPNGLAYCTRTDDLTFKPVRFREYSFKEAKGLIGKVVEYVTSEGYRVSQSVHSVQEGKGLVYINDADHEEYMRMQATIGGLPIGVPEVDEEAMKEVE